MTNNIINIDPPTPEAGRLWAKALELSEAFGPGEAWTLIGGLMVQLHGFEHGSQSRPTRDIDVLGDSRRRPPMTERIADILIERGGEMEMPPVTDEDLGYKFELDGEIIEILGSEGVKNDLRTIGKHTTFQVPGGSQALKRTESVLVSLDGARAIELRRPSLLGAILIKARAVAERRPEKFESDRQDLIRLLSFVDDPRALARDEELKATESGWLRSIDGLLDFRDPVVAELFPAADLTRAEQAYRLLVA
jgi:hypothetical protein